MSILGWLIVGFVAGALASKATGTSNAGCLPTIAIGIVGALLGGWLFRVTIDDDSDAMSELSIGSILVAFVGAVVLLLIMQALGVADRPRRGR